jgi:hypothetical protein
MSFCFATFTHFTSDGGLPVISSHFIALEIRHLGEELRISVADETNARNIDNEKNPGGRPNLTVRLQALPAVAGSTAHSSTSHNGRYEFKGLERGIYLLQIYDGNELYLATEVDTRSAVSQGQRIHRQDEREAERLHNTPALLNATATAKRCIQAKRDLTIWYAHSDNNLLKKATVYQNGCDRAVKTQLVTSSGHQPRNALLSDSSGWKLHESRVTQFVLTPGEERLIETTLSWYRLPTTIPVFRVKELSVSFTEASE